CERALVLLGRQGDAYDECQQIGRRHARRDVAGVNGPGHEGCGCLLELSRTALDRCARAVAGVEGEGDREASGLDAVPQYLVEEVGQSRASILMLDQRRRQAAQLVDPLTEDGMHE